MRTNSFLWRLTAAAFVLAVLFVGNGCSMFPGKDDPVIVKESQLNWLEISYLPGKGKAPVQISLLGSGNIRIKRGTSPQISNNFSQDVANVKWNDVNVDQINVEPAQMRDVFQTFVERGLRREPDKDFVASAKNGTDLARIIGSLDNEHIARLAIEPELIGFIRDLLKLFDENKHLPEATH